jgi:hypothetical protein
MALPGSAAAQADPQVKSTRQKGGATITLSSGTLRVVQKLTTDAFDLRVVDARDEFRITGNLAGHVSVQRGVRRHAFSMRTAGAADRAAILALLDGSPALRAFDQVMTSTWAKTKQAAVFRSADALIALFRGSYQPTVALVASMAAPAAGVVPVRRDGPDACWSAYSHDVVGYTYDLEACVAEARDSWLPWALGWCAYEYDLKTSLAFVWMLDCYSLI